MSHQWQLRTKTALKSAYIMGLSMHLCIIYTETVNMHTLYWVVRYICNLYSHLLYIYIYDTLDIRCSSCAHALFPERLVPVNPLSEPLAEIIDPCRARRELTHSSVPQLMVSARSSRNNPRFVRSGACLYSKPQQQQQHRVRVCRSSVSARMNVLVCLRGGWVCVSWGFWYCPSLSFSLSPSWYEKGA